MKYPGCRIQVFAKAPLPGKVMTRLHSVLGPDGCAELHTRLVRQTLDTLVRSQLCQVELWCSPDCGHVFFTGCRQDYSLSLHEQSGSDLGQRMHNAIRHSLASCDAVILTGTDCPSLTVSDIDEACSALLAGSGVVLGPAGDGGYYLVGMRTAQDRLFTDIPWGSGEVLEQTLARVGELGMKVHLLPQRDDIDTPADYRRLVEHDTSCTRDLPGLAEKRE